MTVKKYKTFEEAEKDLWILSPDKEYFKKILKLFDNKLCCKVRKCPKGVFKYKTFEEAENERFKWLLSQDH